MIECLYIVIESGGFCPRSLVIPIDVIKKNKNLEENLDILIKACEEIQPSFFVYKKMPYVRKTTNVCRVDPNPTEAEKIVICLEYYGDDTPSKWWLFDKCDSGVDAGFPPLYVNGWFKDVDIDVYRRCGMDVVKIGDDKDANIVKTIYVRDAPIPD
jgi:hypothetical protein